MSTGGKIALVFVSLALLGGIGAFVYIETKPAPPLAVIVPQVTTTQTNSTNGILTDAAKIIPFL